MTHVESIGISLTTSPNDTSSSATQIVLGNNSVFLQILKTAGIKFFGYSCFEASPEHIQDLKSPILHMQVLF